MGAKLAGACNIPLHFALPQYRKPALTNRVSAGWFIGPGAKGFWAAAEMDQSAISKTLFAILPA